ncbi:MAG: type 4a pilus biogenesis protein PilO [Thermodesulfobacteriota bacterium]
MNIKGIQSKIDVFLDEKVAGLDQNMKMAALAAIVVIPLVGFYFLSFSPQNAKLKQLEGQKVGLLQTIRRVEAIAANIGKHRAEMAEAQFMFQKASNLLPQQQEIPALLASLSDLGSNSGLEILSFKPGGENQKEFYAEIPISINLQGPYHNIGVFLDKVSKMSRIVSVSSLGISSPKEDEGEMILKTSLKLETYRFVENLTEQAKK